MLDADLASRSGVPTKGLLQAARRNAERFPEDFMFELAPEDWEVLRSQIGPSKGGRSGRRYAPFIFTGRGVAMPPRRCGRHGLRAPLPQTFGAPYILAFKSPRRREETVPLRYS